MTPEQIAANRAAAVTLIRQQQGLSDIPPTAWTYDQRVAYNKALADYIAQNPAQFTPQDQTIAANVQQAVYAPLGDTSILSDLQTFGGALADQALAAGQQVAGIGKGILDTAQLARWAIPAAALIIGSILLLQFYRRHAK